VATISWVPRVNPDATSKLIVIRKQSRYLRSHRKVKNPQPNIILKTFPYAVAMEAAMLAPKAEVSMFPWKEPKERIPLAVRQIRSFLRAHRPASA
jgi:hypothetical protein